jgi:hypothetical protein
MSENVIPIIPIEASQDGRRNAYTHHCQRIKQNRHYAVCLHLIEKRKAGRLDIIYSDCSAAIGRKDCPAIGMRAEEVRQGRAIYFQERIRAMGAAFTMAAQALLAGKSKIDQEALQAEAPKVSKSSVIDKIDDTGYSAAINNALKSGAHAKHAQPEKAVENAPVADKKRAPRKTKVEQAPVEVKAEPIAQPATAQAGESLLEMARRMMKQNGGK